MNCKQCREKILESLAAGTEGLTPGVSVHQSSCPACAEFYTLQQDLFQAVDAGLRSLVNQTVPPSLLPAVRILLDEEFVPRRARVFSRSFAMVATVAILAIGFGYVLLSPRNHPNFLESTAITSRSTGNSEPAAQPFYKSAIVSPKPAARRTVPVVSSTAASGVIVLAEERQAFAKFVAEVPEGTEVALAPLRPLQEPAGDPVEIALLRIERLEVTPLDPAASE